MPGTAQTQELIYDGPHVQVLARRGSSDYALVTFNERGFRADGRSIWAQALVDRLDLNAVGFVTKAPNWFPPEDFARACAAALPALSRFDRRIGYGFSQGGYAAIRASRALALTQTLAVSPQWSIDPAEVIDRRFAKFFSPELNAAMRIIPEDAPRALHIAYDHRLAPDREHVDRIVAAIPSAHLHPVPSTLHETIRVFVGSQNFAELVEALEAGRPEATLSRMRRASQVRRMIMIERATRARRLDRAFALFAAIAPDGERRALLLAGFARAGAADRALSIAMSDAAERPDDPATNAALAVILARLARVTEARHHIAVSRATRLRARVRRIVDLAERLLDALEPPVTSAAPVPPPSSDAARPSRRTAPWSGRPSPPPRRPE